MRVTAVGRRLFAAEIHSGSPAVLDWRVDYERHDYAHCEVPESVGAGLRLTLDRLGLGFAACDFVVNPDGQWFFVDLNPQGQWLWLEIATGMPVSAALADLLANPPADDPPVFQGYGGAGGVR